MTMQHKDIPLGSLVLSKQNVRKNLDAGQEDAVIDDLARSIAEKGLLQPLIVRPTADGKYEVVAGQRRLEACKGLGLNSISCSVRHNCSDEDAQSVSLIENIQRADMHPLDKADALKTLYKKHGSYDGVAKETGWSKQTIKRYVGLTNLPESLKQRLGASEGSLSVGALSELAKRYEGDDAIAVYDKINGFNATWQTQIIKRSGGDISLVDDLIEDAHRGAFDIRRCDLQYGCQVIRSIIAGEISDTEFKEMVEAAAAPLASTLLATNGENPVHAFWKALSQRDD